MVSKATNQNGFVSEYEYDIYGQKIKETDPNKNITENEYDLLGQVVKTIEPRKQLSITMILLADFFL